MKYSTSVDIDFKSAKLFAVKINIVFYCKEYKIQ